MKISRLLVLTALWLGMTSSAKAEVPDGVWTIPDPSGSLEFTSTMPTQSGEAYLYNPAAKMFFASGNEWNTRASLASFGYDVWFTAAEEEDAPAGTYVFNDMCNHPDRQLGEKTLFTDDGGATWCDRGTQANWSWSVVIDANGYVRIQNAALIADKPDYDGKFFGWNGTADNRLYMLDPASEGAAVDWKFVTAASYEAFIYSDDYFSRSYAHTYKIIRTFKVLARELDIPIFITSNLKNVPRDFDTLNCRPKLCDLLDDGVVENFSDKILLLHRPEFYHFYQDEYGRDMRGVAILQVEKNKGGYRGDIFLNFKEECGKFTNYDPFNPMPLGEGGIVNSKANEK